MRIWTAAGFALAMTFGHAQAETAAKPVIYDCKIASSQGSWITERYFFAQDPATGKIAVMDALISAFNNKKPLEFVPTKADAGQWVLDWRIDVINNAGQRARMVFHAVIFRQTGQMNIDDQVTGYINVFSGSGHCVLTNLAALKAMK